MKVTAKGLRNLQNTLHDESMDVKYHPWIYRFEKKGWIVNENVKKKWIIGNEYKNKME